MNSNALLAVLALWCLLHPGLAEQDEGLGPNPGPGRVAEQDQRPQPQLQSSTRKDKRGLFATVFGYEPYPYAGPAVPYGAYGAYGAYGVSVPPAAVPVALTTADAYGPRSYGAYKAVAAPAYGPYANGYPVRSAPVAKVAYGPVPAYAAYTDSVYSRVGAYAPYGGYGVYGAYEPHGQHAYVTEGYNPAYAY